MKTITKIVALLVVAAIAVGMTGCNKDAETNSEPVYYTVSFDTDGAGDIDPQTIEKGQRATKPDDPTKEGFNSFDWMNGDTVYDFSKPVKSDLPLKAKWYLGTKTPSTAKAVGDIVFSDGSAIPYSDTLSLTKNQMSKAIAIIFYKGTDCSDDGSERTLGMGLAYGINIPLCVESAEAYKITIDTIMEDVKNGSGNFDKIGKFSGVTDTGNRTKYPGWYFAIEYADQKGSNVKGTDYATGWYIPTKTELQKIYDKKDDIINSGDKCGVSLFSGTVTVCWSSSQYDQFATGHWIISLTKGTWDGLFAAYTNTNVKDMLLCCIHEF